MAKSNVFLKLPAQILLQDSSVTFSGYLERKISLLTFKHWIKCYVVISNGNIYVYTSNTSLKPSFVCILGAFHQIQIIKNRVQPPFWVFILKPLIESVPELKFASASEREMKSWICEFKAGIIFSKNAQLKKDSRKLVDPSTRDNMEDSIYRTLSEKDYVMDTLLNSDRSNIYEEPDEMLFQSNNVTPTAPPLYPSISEFDNMSFKVDIGETVENAIFTGTREAAFTELSKCPHLGSYLVRNDNGRQILTVKCENNIVKYCLVIQPKTNRITIAGQKESFENLYHLLSYYHEHLLPNQNCKLLIPFRLITNV